MNTETAVCILALMGFFWLYKDICNKAKIEELEHKLKQKDTPNDP